MKRNRVIKKCEWCGRIYETIPSHAHRRRFCSIQCAALARREECNSRRKCQNCGKTFVVKRWERHIVCSVECAQQLRSKRLVKRCVLCGKQYETRWSRRNTSRFCSKECKAMATRKVRRPSAKQLRYLVVHHTLQVIADIYGVNYGTVRYWCKCYGFRNPTRKERKQLQRIYIEWRREDLARLMGLLDRKGYDV